MVAGPRYTIILTRQARKQIDRLPLGVQARVSEAIDSLEFEPRPVGCKKLKGNGGLWRIAHGDYRVLYTIEDRRVIVTVARVAYRRDVYRDL